MWKKFSSDWGGCRGRGLAGALRILSISYFQEVLKVTGKFFSSSIQGPSINNVDAAINISVGTGKSIQVNVLIRSLQLV